MLSTRDLEDVLAVGREVAEYNEPDALREHVLLRLESIFKTHASNFFLANGSAEQINLSRVHTRGVSETDLRAFREHYFKWDPFLKARFCRDADVFTFDHVTTFDRMLKSTYYNEFLKPQSIYSQMTIYLRRRSTLLGVVALFRPPNAPRFSVEDVLKAETMRPYLTAALEKTIALNENVQKELIINSINSETAYKGIMILDDVLEPTYYNEQAAILCSPLYTDQERKAKNDALPRILRQRCDEFWRSVVGSNSETARTTQFRLKTCGNHEIVVSLRFETFLQRRQFLLVFIEPADPASCLLDRLTVFGLTRRQIEVVSLVCEGFSNSEISRKLYISEYTVENHLRTIYEKMEVKNRTSLAHRVATLSKPHALIGANGYDRQENNARGKKDQPLS